MRIAGPAQRIEQALTVGVTRVSNPPEGRGCLDFVLSTGSVIRIHPTDEERAHLAITALAGGQQDELSAALARDPNGGQMMKLLLQAADKYAPCPACKTLNLKTRSICSECTRYLEAGNS